MGIYYFVKVEEGMEFFKAPFSKDENKYFAKEKSKAIARALKRKIPNVVFKRSTLKDIDNIVEDLDKPYDYKFNDI
jgi:DNA primase